jgi:cupin fold WbuC family metalloprotein
MRLCAHRGVEDRVHEMVIAVSRGVYFRPHKHLGRTESTHVIEGQADLVVFTEAGEIREVIGLGDYRSGRTFFIRMSEPHYHMLLVRSEMFVFHEVVQGPLERHAIAFAPWAPDEGDTAGRNEFLRRVAEAAAQFP